jgi:hypothetical protein
VKLSYISNNLAITKRNQVVTERSRTVTERIRSYSFAKIALNVALGRIAAEAFTKSGL